MPQRSRLATEAEKHAGPGKRELNKAGKRHRIRTAARELFAEHGFDETSLQSVAARAGVGFGTLFDYASNKRDLLFLVFNPDLYAALNEGCAAADCEELFIEQVMRVFESYYTLYRRDPALSRSFLRELNFYSEGTEAQVFMAQRGEFLVRLRRLADSALAAGQLSAEGAPELMAQLMLSLFAWEVRRWLSDEPLDLDGGLTRLRRLLALQITGFGPAAQGAL